MEERASYEAMTPLERMMEGKTDMEVLEIVNNMFDISEVGIEIYNSDIDITYYGDSQKRTKASVILDAAGITHHKNKAFISVIVVAGHGYLKISK